MRDPADPHPSAAQLTAFDTGQLPASERRAVEQHVTHCPECCRALDALPEDPLAALLRASAGRHEPDTAAPAAEDSALAVPAALAGHPRYRVLEVLGAGGMGVVYKAVHRLMDRVVALKVIHRHLTDRPAFVERFRREVRAAARLAHPNIVTAHDADQAGDTHFLVMEYVAGTSLDREVQRRGPLPVPEACALVRQAALGLQHAHERGMVHRDVKPANLLLSPSPPSAPLTPLPPSPTAGRGGSKTASLPLSPGWERGPGGEGFGTVKILDFGLAHLLGAEDEEAVPAAAVLGTPDYLAPEQARDPRHGDVRADVYSLGCTLYHLLAGRPPFPDGTPLQKLLAHQDRQPPPVTAARGDVPAALVAILDRMLAKDPARRYQTAGAVAAALAPLAGLPAAAEGGRRSRLPLVVTAVVVVLLGLGVAASWPAWRGLFRDSPPAAEQPPPPEPEKPPPASSPVAEPLPEVVTLRQGPLSRAEIRAEIIAWVKANNRWGPECELVGRVVEELDASLPRADGCQLALGSRLLKAEQTSIVAAHPGGLFLLALPAELAQDMGVKPTARVTRWFVPKGREVRPERARVLLSRLTIDNRDHLDGRQQVTGSLAYHFNEKSEGEYALRLTFYTGTWRRILITYPKGLGATADGELHFAFGPLQDDKGPRGPLVVFLELASRQGDQTVIASNAVAALVRVMPGK
jgi:hypothetical protein